MRDHRRRNARSLLDSILHLLSQALGRSRADKGIGRTSAAVLAAAVLCTGLVSYSYLRYALVRDRTSILEAELERRSQQLSLSILARIQVARALGARDDTAHAMLVYQSDDAGAIERTGALMTLQATAGKLMQAGELRGVELRTRARERIPTAAYLQPLPELNVALFNGNDIIYWDQGFVIRVSVDVVGEDGTAGTMLADLRVWDADGAIKGIDRLGETGEAGLCGLNSSRRVCFPSRFQPLGSIGDVQTPARLPSDMALNGESGTLDLLDYRNHETYSSFQSLEGFGLAVIVKMDKAELLAPVRQQMMLGIPALILLAAAGALLIGRQLRPLTAELVAAGVAIRLTNRRLQMVADNASMMVAFLDPQLVYQFANRAHEDWFQRPLSRIVGQPMDAVVGPASAADYRKVMAVALATGQPQTIYREKTRAGVTKFTEVTFVAQLDGDSRLEGYCVTVRDSTQSVLREKTLLLAARLDPLTGLCNRSRFDELLEKALLAPRVESGLLAVAYIDLDHFKRVNDSFGHDVGDHLLKELGRRLESSLTSSDTVARLGGDEFAVIMHLSAPADAHALGYRLLASIRQPFRVGPHFLRPSASIGFAVAVPGDIASALLKRADIALYDAKDSGRNGIRHATLARVPVPAT